MLSFGLIAGSAQEVENEVQSVFETWWDNIAEGKSNLAYKSMIQGKSKLLREMQIKSLENFGKSMAKGKAAAKPNIVATYQDGNYAVVVIIASVDEEKNEDIDGIYLTKLNGEWYILNKTVTWERQKFVDQEEATRAYTRLDLKLEEFKKNRRLQLKAQD